MDGRENLWHRTNQLFELWEQNTHTACQNAGIDKRVAREKETKTNQQGGEGGEEEMRWRKRWMC